MHHKDYLKRQSVRLKSNDYNKAYKRCNNKQEIIETTKKEYFEKKSSNVNNSNEGWQYINELLNKRSKSTQVTQLDVEGQIISGDAKIANCFNEYFSSIGGKLSEYIQNVDIDLMIFIKPKQNLFQFSNITACQDFDAINQLNSKKSPGLDDISAK